MLPYHLRTLEVVATFAPSSMILRELRPQASKHLRARTNVR